MSNALVVDNYVTPEDRLLALRGLTVVPGYVAQRLRPLLTLPEGYSGAFYPFQCEVWNDGTANVVVKLVQTSDDAASGTRSHLAAFSVTPGGRKQVNAIIPTKKFVEVKGVEGNGPVRVNIMTKIGWDIESFNFKTDTTYAAKLWSGADPVPTAATSATQTFTSSTTWTVTHNLGFLADVTLLDSNGVDVTGLGTISSKTTTGYVATFAAATAGRAISTY